ncbi:MAG: class I SAM-dependent methyltransferase [Chloroflexota bacterium]
MTTNAASYLFADDERERLQAAEEFLDEGTIRHIQEIGIGPGARCLEVGAGGGSIARWLVSQVGPDGHVVATDINVNALTLRALPANLEIRQHDIVREPLEEDTFDLVHARLVLEHLPEREQALQKMARALRPGGWVLIEDMDHVSTVAVSELGADEHERTTAIRLREFAKTGFDQALGRKLPAHLRAQGLINVGNEGRVFVTEGGSPGARWLQLSLKHLRPRLVGPDKLSDAELDRMLELIENPAWSAMGGITMAAWGQRPPKPVG